MVPIPTLVVALLVLFCFSAFFSASEAALISLNKVRIRHMAEQKKRGARRVYSQIQRMDKLIATILVGNNIVNTAIASILTLICVHFFGAGKALLIVTVMTTVLLVIFGELTPKIIATTHPEWVAFSGRHLTSFFLFIFRPVTGMLTAASNGLIQIFGGNPHFRSPLVTEEEMKMMITIGKEEGIYGENERKMLERIFHFDEVEVRDVMTPIEDMTAIPIDVSNDELERVIQEEGHNRLPIYRSAKSDIVGIIYVRDLLYLFKNSALIHIEDLMSAPFWVLPNQKASELLKDFQRKKIQIAMVKDPKSEKAIGLVTLEDLIEEIVGEIEERDTGL